MIPLMLISLMAPVPVPADQTELQVEQSKKDLSFQNEIGHAIDRGLRWLAGLLSLLFF